MEELTFSPKPSSILGIPIEKVHHHHNTVEYLYTRNNFAPILENNQIHSQGYFNELSAFVESVEGRAGKVLTSLQSVKDTYQLGTGVIDRWQSVELRTAYVQRPDGRIRPSVYHHRRW